TQQELIEDYLKQDLGTPFRVDASSSWRMNVFPRGAGNIVLVFIFHHAILDGWSTTSLMSELNNTYLRLKTVPGYIPPLLGCGYKDSFIEEMVDKRNLQAIEYWKNELEGYKRTEFAETLKSDNQAKGMKVFQTNAGGNILKKLQDLTGMHATSLKHICFGAYLFVIYMLTHESDLVVGVVNNNRPVHEDGDKVLGCFLITIPVRIQIPTNITWAGYINMIETKLQEVRQYERFSLFEIARVVEEKNKDRNPFFDTLFNFTDFHIFREIDVEEISDSEPGEPPGDEEPNVIAGPLSLRGSQITNTLFDFEVDITSGVLLIHPKYDPSVISDEVVQKSCVYFEQVLNKFIREPDTLLTKNAILPLEEKQKLLHEFNDTTAEYSKTKTMPRLFEDQVEQTPHHIAVIGPTFQIINSINSKLQTGYNSISITYRELNEKTNQLARTLREKGVTLGDLVAVIMNR
ncbi:MAG: AMP-binding protein, partial [bacterium]|nr:AMP-binding protein [bacterium]